MERKGHLDILYVNDEQAAVLNLAPGFVRMYKGEVKRSRADAIADHRILANQPDGEYAAANFEDCSIYRWVGKAGWPTHCDKAAMNGAQLSILVADGDAFTLQTSPWLARSRQWSMSSLE